ncbi:MAG: undecaprenyl-phosphate galactose phosphotransferase WbaP [Acidobacteria bacterium]|nr:undecaprenyl-phosphate galactose phosphotransferase WbaP [Acidobacteriota bacterium]
MLSDTVALSIAIALGAGTWAFVTRPAAIDLSSVYIVAIAVALVSYAAKGLYTGFGITETEQLRKIVGTNTFVYLTITAALFLSKQSTSQSRGVFLCSWVLSIIFVPLFRATVTGQASRQNWWGHPALIVGGGTRVTSLLELFHSNPALGIRPVAVVGDTDAPPAAGLALLPDMEAGEAVASLLGLSHAVVVESGPGTQALLDRCAARFKNVLVIPQLDAKTSLWIDPKDLGGTLGLELRHNLLIPLNRWLKRALDLAVAIAAGIIALPIIAISAAWICSVSAGSPFFTQSRETSHGRSFKIFKLRTMYPDAEGMLLQYLEHSPTARAEWERDFKLKNDPRVLPGIGKFLRCTSFDELPQLWNVLIGDMSAVGPRPIITAEIERYGSTFDIVRRVKPGLTGLWQVSGRNDVSYAERVRLDAYYVRNWSIWLDLTILARTVRVVVLRTGL